MICMCFLRAPKIYASLHIKALHRIQNRSLNENENNKKRARKLKCVWSWLAAGWTVQHVTLSPGGHCLKDQWCNVVCVYFKSWMCASCPGGHGMCLRVGVLRSLDPGRLLASVLSHRSQPCISVGIRHVAGGQRNVSSVPWHTCSTAQLHQLVIQTRGVAHVGSECLPEG